MFDQETVTPTPTIVIHESGVPMGKEAYDTGKRPEGVFAIAATVKEAQAAEEPKAGLDKPASGE